MGFFSSILGASPFGVGAMFKKPVDSSARANEYLNKIPGVAEKNLSPYIMPGQQSQDFVNQIMAGYKPSEGYNFQQEQLNKQLSSNAAAGGYAGGGRDQEQRGELIQKLLSGDMQQWLQNVLGVHNQSYNASNELTNYQTGALNQQGGLAFGAGENANQRQSDLQNALLGFAGNAAGFGKGGGFNNNQNQGSQADFSSLIRNLMSQQRNQGGAAGGQGWGYNASNPSASTVPGANVGYR
jgi:hypothetical protein